MIIADNAIYSHPCFNFHTSMHSLLFKNAYDPHLYDQVDLQSHWNTVSDLFGGGAAAVYSFQPGAKPSLEELGKLP